MKNAIDWASRPHGDSAWNGKPAAIMGASTGAIGTARAQNHLRQILVYLNMFPINQPEVLISNAMDLRASGVGWYSSTVGLLELVASVVAGLLWDRVGHAAVFYYGAAFAFAGSIGLIVLIPKHHHHSAA